ncbi:MAG: sigma-70 family RNA polymerase sigma factor [Xylophilus ampelinus]
MHSLTVPSDATPPQHQIRALYSDHHGWLQGWLRKKLGCTCRAADLAQDTFLRLLTSRVPARLDEPRAYLTTVARNLLLNHQRRQKLEQAWLAELALAPPACAPSVEERAMVLETLVAIDALLDGLSPRARRAFLMSQLDGMTYAEIAAEIGVSVSRVRQYMSEALARCYAALG